MMARTSTAPPPCTPDPARGHHCPHHEGIGFSSHSYFVNVYTHISDPSVFTVPSYCKKDVSTARFGDDDQLPTILERFVML